MLPKKPSPLQESAPDSALEFVRVETLAPNSSLPLVLRPRIPDVDLAEWIEEQRPWLDLQLRRCGAVLFRRFDIGSIAGFERCAAAACGELFGGYGDLPPERGAGRVYQSTPFPAHKTILFHNESSHLPRWPLRQFFYCVQPATEGGETPLVDCREIYARLDTQIRERLESKELLYVRNFADGLDVSWQEFFKTSDRLAVEAQCRESGMMCEWKPAGLCITNKRPAVACHPVTGEKTFFNQIQLHHLSCLDANLREALCTLFSSEDLPRHVMCGDGTPIEDEHIRMIVETYWQCAVAFRWQQDDMLMLDNMLVAHARNPFVGSRKIVVAMGDMTKGDA